MTDLQRELAALNDCIERWCDDRDTREAVMFICEAVQPAVTRAIDLAQAPPLPTDAEVEQWINNSGVDLYVSDRSVAIRRFMAWLRTRAEELGLWRDPQEPA